MLKELRPRHREMARLSFQGFEAAEIAQRLGNSVDTVRRTLRDPLCKGFIDGLMDRADEDVVDVRKRLVSMNAMALDAFDRILKEGTEAPFAVQFNAAKDLMDRNGYKAPSVHEVNHKISQIPDDELDAKIKAMEGVLGSSGLENESGGGD